MLPRILSSLRTIPKAEVELSTTQNTTAAAPSLHISLEYSISNKTQFNLRPRSQHHVATTTTTSLAHHLHLNCRQTCSFPGVVSCHHSSAYLSFTQTEQSSPYRSLSRSNTAFTSLGARGLVHSPKLPLPHSYDPRHLRAAAAAENRRPRLWLALCRQ